MPGKGLSSGIFACLLVATSGLAQAQQCLMAACKPINALLILHNGSEPPRERSLSSTAGSAGYWTASALWTSQRTRRGLYCAPHSSRSPALPPPFQCMSCCRWTLSGCWSGMTGRCASQAYALHIHEASSLAAIRIIAYSCVKCASRLLLQQSAGTGCIRLWPRLLLITKRGGFSHIAQVCAGPSHQAGEGA